MNAFAQDRKRFVIRDPSADQNVQQLHQALEPDGILPNEEAKDIFALSDGCGYDCLYSFHCVLNPFLVDEMEALELVPRHPIQDGTSYHKYCRSVDFYHQMRMVYCNMLMST